MNSERAGWVGAGLMASLLAAVPAAAQEVIRLPADDRPIALELEELYSVGSASGAPWEQFQSLDDAAFDDRGRLHLLDGTGQSVVVVGPAGEFVRRLGRPGSGPGEYENAAGLAVLPDGRTAIWDSRKRAFLMFDRDGTALDEVSPGFQVGLPDAPFATVPDGTLLAAAAMIVTGSRGRLYMTGTGFEPAAGSLPLLRVPLEDDASAEAVLRMAVPADRATTGSERLTRAFEPLPSWAMLDDGAIAVVDSDQYRIEIFGADGSLRRTLARPVPARPVTDRDREAYRRSLREQYERLQARARSSGGGLQPVPPGRPVAFHPVIPPIQELTSDGHDHLWIQRPHPEDPTRPGPIDLLTASGGYVGTIPERGLGLPAAFGPDGRVVFLTLGEFDVPIARVYRLPVSLTPRYPPPAPRAPPPGDWSGRRW